MYIILPSNTSDFTSNKTNSFRVKLPQPLSLTGEWEIALTELQYPTSWNTVKQDEAWIKVEYQHEHLTLPVLITVQAGYYNRVTDLIDAINYAIEAEGEKLPNHIYKANYAGYRLAKFKLKDVAAFNEWQKRSLSYREIFADPTLVPDVEWSGSMEPYSTYLAKADQRRLNPPQENMLSTAIRFRFDPVIGRVRLYLSKLIKRIQFHKSLQFMLGFSDGKGYFSDNNNVADYNPDITGTENSFFVYCSIVEPQIVGSSLKQLLRTVPVELGELGATVHKEFLTPHYVGLLSNEFDTIQIEIRNDFGELVDFQFGKVILKVHLRRKTLLNLQ